MEERKKRADKLPVSQIETVADAVMLEQRIAKWEEGLVQKGKIEGVLLGKKEGIDYQKATMLEMLSDRFG